MTYPAIWRKQAPSVWDEMFNMRNEFDRLLGRSETQMSSLWYPAVDIHESKDGNECHVMERRYGRFERRFSLPRSVDAGKVKAEFDNGILRVSLPKAEAAKPRRIEIKTSAK